MAGVSLPQSRFPCKEACARPCFVFSWCPFFFPLGGTDRSGRKKKKGSAIYRRDVQDSCQKTSRCTTFFSLCVCESVAPSSGHRERFLFSLRKKRAPKMHCSHFRAIGRHENSSLAPKYRLKKRALPNPQKSLSSPPQKQGDTTEMVRSKKIPMALPLFNAILKARDEPISIEIARLSLADRVILTSQLDRVACLHRVYGTVVHPI